MMSETSFHVALTGHRPSKLAGYDLSHPFYLTLQARLEHIIETGLHKHSHLTLHSGLALGADTVWSQAALAQRDRHPEQIAFVAEVPLMTQSSKWPAARDKKFWQEQIDRADAIHVYAEHYTPRAMQLRNEGMIDAAELLLAVWDGSNGGTGHAVRYAEGKNIPVFRIEPQSLHALGSAEAVAASVADQAPLPPIQAPLPPIQVVNKRTSEYDVYIGRGSVWGNPFVIGKDGDREEVVRKFEEYLAVRPTLIARLPELLGKRIACFCAPLLCHGHVLKRWAERHLVHV